MELGTSTKRSPMEKIARLYQLKGMIEKEIPFVDIKPFSHNIINMELRMVSKEYGKIVANNMVIQLGLDKMGWKVEPLD